MSTRIDMLAASSANEPPCAEALLVAAAAIVKVYCQGIHYFTWSCWETVFPGNGWNRPPKRLINGIYCFIPLLFCSIHLTKKTSTLTRFVLLPRVSPLIGIRLVLVPYNKSPEGQSVDVIVCDWKIRLVFLCLCRSHHIDELRYAFGLFVEALHDLQDFYSINCKEPRTMFFKVVKELYGRYLRVEGIQVF